MLLPLFLFVIQLQGFIEKFPAVSTTSQNKPESGLKAFLKNISNNKNKVAEVGK